MKRGSFVIYEKPKCYIEFRTVDRKFMSSILFFDIAKLQPLVHRYSVIRYRNQTEKILRNIPFPTQDCKRDHYEIEDEVFYQLRVVSLLGVLYFGTITKKQNGLYVIDNLLEQGPEQLIPYNWYSLHAKCRLAIKWWLLIGKRLCICKDVRKLIAAYIWRLRNEYAWDCNHKHTRRRKTHKRIKYNV